MWKEVSFFKKKENKSFKPVWSHSIKNDSVSFPDSLPAGSLLGHTLFGPTLEDTEEPKWIKTAVLEPVSGLVSPSP